MTSTTAPVAALQVLDGIVVSTGDATVCQRWLGEVRRVRGFLDAVEAQVLSRIEALATAGESFGAEHTSVRCSGCRPARPAR